MRGRRWWRSLSSGPPTPLKGESDPMEVAKRRTSNTSQGRVIPNGKRGYLKEWWRSLSAGQATPLKGKSYPMESMGLLRDGGGR
jgi:hypothetical protein